MSSGERPIGAAKGKQSDIEALCQPPPPPPGGGGTILGPWVFPNSGWVGLEIPPPPH